MCPVMGYESDESNAQSLVSLLFFSPLWNYTTADCKRLVWTNVSKISSVVHKNELTIIPEFLSSTAVAMVTHTSLHGTLMKHLLAVVRETFCWCIIYKYPWRGRSIHWQQTGWKARHVWNVQNNMSSTLRPSSILSLFKRVLGGAFWKLTGQIRFLYEPFQSTCLFTVYLTWVK